ncbi:hypothetical protein GYMLUDRAFT_40125 [Collybiopsis luxurians FD-317 M1]|uniref:Unplaced genomic scaffold GYMLUscaffold_14, whole genome shotgun sequence n=1 Tax=Collybiopsis luxurians FD-317 M1 TaxID=944289 RepID=A0A0D0D3Q9_9AGAR|nr:hypothetical protein GYMLUDRAFT_40125 [Collybiopsis luxurians FD-317 M1]
MSSFQTFISKVGDVVTDLKPVGQTITSLPAILDAVRHPESINDRLLLLEKLLTLMAELGDSKAPPEYQKISLDLQHLAIDLLYKDLPHPPASYLALPPASKPISAKAPTPYKEGQYVTYAYRSADGSNYNPLIPSLGQAGTPYARSSPGFMQTNFKNLPDAGLVFDTLLRRPTKAEAPGEKADGFTPHPGGVNSLFFALADIIIHTLFNTDRQNPTVNNTSSYLDLSVVYGNNEDEVESVRRKDDQNRRDGIGRLYEDVFADNRLLLMPPATCALLVLFSRNHNFVAQRIFEINERGIYKDPATLKAQMNKGFAPGASAEDEKLAKQAKSALNAQDDEIFHRSRLVNCGFYMKVILGDYVGAILGLVKDGKDWRLDPLMEIRRLSHEFSPRGEGNVVSLEFNLLYRWHATLSREDKAWTEKTFKEVLAKAGINTTFDQLTRQQFYRAAGLALSKEQLGDVRTWTFDNLKRDSNGKFSDADIANILQRSTSYRAGAFKARGIPDVLKVIEVLGIEQARGWGACSLNEFRKFIGLEPYKSFKQWNSDESVARAAELLYKDIDNLELHVGMQAEQSKVPGPGAGLCPGYTISRAILSDAVCLTRGDRFLTVDFTPFNFTTWGFEDCQYPSTPDGSFGGMLTKLLFRHFPAYYPARSAYAHFPLLDPKFMKVQMEQAGTADKYIWTRPQTPVGVQTGETVVVDSYAGATEVLYNPKVWKSDYEKKLGIVVSGLQDPKLPDTKLVEEVLRSSSHGWPGFFVETANRLVKERSINHAGSTARYVDIVDDVINALPAHWICDKLIGLNLRDKKAESQFVTGLQDVCDYVFLDWDPVHDWQLRESSVAFFQKLHKVVKHHLESESRFIPNIIGHLLDEKTPFLETLHRDHGNKSANELAAALFCQVVPTAAHWSQSVAHVINYYLDASREGAREEIVKLVDEGKTKQAMDLIKTALVVDPPVYGAERTALRATVVDGLKEAAAGETVFVSIVEANQNIPIGKSGIIGAGEYGLLAAEFFEKVTPGVVGAILGLPKLGRCPGPSGVFTRFTQHTRGAPEQIYINALGGLTPFPTSLIISYDESQSKI